MAMYVREDAIIYDSVADRNVQQITGWILRKIAGAWAAHRDALDGKDNQDSTSYERWLSALVAPHTKRFDGIVWRESRLLRLDVNTLEAALVFLITC